MTSPCINGNGLLKRNLEMTDVGERTYFLYIPSSLCSSPDTTNGDEAQAADLQSDTVPIVFVLHCFGCTAKTMMHMTKISDTYSFVMVIPEGISSSWNSKYCCGYALDNGIDDVGFLSRIIETVESDTDGLVSKDAAYGIGWSNGGYMVTYAAGLFRAIAPISGHIYDVQEDIHPARTADSATAIFMHHSANDPYVRMAGCCTDSSMPKCCCGISQHVNACISAEGVLRSWAVDVNGCASDSAMSLSMEDNSRGVTCHTIGGVGCRANSTICVHSTEAHFNKPSFEAAFKMHDEIGDFFARDACSINAGTWSAEDRRCKCDSASAGGRYCLLGSLATGGVASTKASPVGESSKDKHLSSSSSSASFVGLSGTVFIIFFLSVQWLKRHKPDIWSEASEVRKDVEMGSLMADRDLRS